MHELKNYVKFVLLKLIKYYKCFNGIRSFPKMSFLKLPNVSFYSKRLYHKSIVNCMKTCCTLYRHILKLSIFYKKKFNLNIIKHSLLKKILVEKNSSEKFLSQRILISSSWNAWGLTQRYFDFNQTKRRKILR